MLKTRNEEKGKAWNLFQLLCVETKRGRGQKSFKYRKGWPKQGRTWLKALASISLQSGEALVSGAGSNFNAGTFSKRHPSLSCRCPSSCCCCLSIRSYLAFVRILKQNILPVEELKNAREFRRTMTISMPRYAERCLLT